MTQIQADPAGSFAEPPDLPSQLKPWFDQLLARLEATQAAQARFEGLLEAAPDAIVIAGTDGRIQLVNRQTETLFGYNRSELVGQPIEMLVPPRLRAGHVHHRAAYGAAPRTRPMGSGLPLYGQRKDGAEFPAEVSLSPISLDGATLVMSAIRDITDRKVTEVRQAAQFVATRILAESATAAEAMPRLLQALCEGLGWELGEFWAVAPSGERLLWSYCWHVPDIDVVDFVAESASLALAHGEGLPGDVWAQRRPVWRTDVVADACFARATAAGRQGLRTAIGFPVTSDGALTGVLVFFSRGMREPDPGLTAVLSDLGSQVGQFLARKVAEDAVHAAMVATEQARADAERAREEAERANAAKSEFLSRMSHELRTPLNAVLGFAQLLEMDALPPAQQRSVARILRAGRHLLDLVNEVLDIARIETGRLPLSLEPVRLAEALREALDLVRPVAAEHAVVLFLDEASADARYAWADRQRLKQVLLNLLTNAIKYNHPGGSVTVRCTATVHDAAVAVVPGALGRVRIAVQDTGPGIAPDKLGRLFTPFDRLGAEMSEVDGTGLGLALAQRLAEAMSGRISVESTIGSGSTFTVDLIEVGRIQRAAGHANGSGSATAEAPDAEHERRTVLYIEDNLPNLELIEELFARWPHVDLLPAMQGRLGVELARQHQPDLILLDVHLPDIGGEEVLHMVRADERTRHIPVVVLSADATAGQIARLKAAGARDYLTKPLDVARFLGFVQDLLHERSVGEPR